MLLIGGANEKPVVRPSVKDFIAPVTKPSGKSLPAIVPAAAPAIAPRKPEPAAKAAPVPTTAPLSPSPRLAFSTKLASSGPAVGSANVASPAVFLPTLTIPAGSIS